MPPAEHALMNACRTLFGDEVSVSPAFLARLQPGGARRAFRSQAKRHHPDRFAGAPADIRIRQTERFRQIHQAYSLLSEFLAARRPAVRAAPHVPRSQPAPQRRRAAPAAGNRSSAPPLPLEFGLFAFYRGAVEYRDLIDALAWQRRQRPPLGELACQQGWLSETKVQRILGERGVSGRFGRKAVALGLLSAHQVETLLRHQRSRQQRLGHYFVERGLLTAAAVDRLADELEQHNARLAGGRR